MTADMQVARRSLGGGQTAYGRSSVGFFEYGSIARPGLAAVWDRGALPWADRTPLGPTFFAPAETGNTVSARMIAKKSQDRLAVPSPSQLPAATTALYWRSHPSQLILKYFRVSIAGAIAGAPSRPRSTASRCENVAA
jgi:hypothetical protein